jgi:uncharacterized membrane protein YbhN (UPF0104 family)
VTRGARRLLRLGVSAGLLALLAWRLDVGEVALRLGDLRPGWVFGALAVSVVQVVASAWRWRYTARRLGLDLPMGVATREYYLATLLNQVLPGGVAGDVTRAWRHADRAVSGTGAISAVLLDRLSGQAVMTAVALLSGAVLLVGSGAGPAPGVAGASVIVGAALILAWVGSRLVPRVMRFPPVARIVEDARRALWGSALPVQLAASLAVVASYLAVFVMAARSVGVGTPLPTLLPLVAPVLVTMLIPITVAGWGLREGAAGALWHSVGLTAADGVAVSVAYGLLVLLSSLPGALFLVLTPAAPGNPEAADPPPGPEGPDRKGGPGPAGSDALEGGEPRRDVPRGGG